MIVPTPDRPFAVVCIWPDRAGPERLWQRFSTLAEAERVAAQLNSVRCPAAVREIELIGESPRPGGRA